MVLGRVAMTAIDHNSLSNTLLLERLLSSSNAFRVEVGALRAASKDNEAIAVTLSTNNSDNTGLSDREEMMGVLCGTNGINSNVERTVGAVLEADRET